MTPLSGAPPCPVTALSRRLSRRGVLAGLLGGTLAWALPGSDRLIRHAVAGGKAGVPGRHYVFCYFGGGWDTLLSLDPRDPALFHDGNAATTGIQPGYDRLSDAEHGTEPLEPIPGMLLGPYIGEMAEWAPRLCIVRGLSMDTLSHETGRRRFLTGRQPSGLTPRGSSLSTHLAWKLGEGQLLPNLSIGVEAFNLDRPQWASAVRVADVDNLVSALGSAPSGLGEDVDGLVDSFLREEALCDRARRSAIWQAAEESRLGAADVEREGMDRLFEFGADNADMERIRDVYGLDDDLDARDRRARNATAAAAQALSSGLSRVVTVELASGLDTHGADWATRQGPNQEAGWNAVARLCSDLASRGYGDGSTWLDHTVIVAFSEFSRTAGINGNGGRDHNISNSCLLIGGTIRGGQVLGRTTDEGMAPHRIDAATGAPREDGLLARPENVLQALFLEAGIEGDPADLRAVPITAVLPASAG